MPCVLWRHEVHWGRLGLPFLGSHTQGCNGISGGLTSADSLVVHRDGRMGVSGVVFAEHRWTMGLSSAGSDGGWVEWLGVSKVMTGEHALAHWRRTNECLVFFWSMLRSEAVWFPRFLQIGENLLKNRAVYGVINSSQMLCSEVEWFQRFPQIFNHHSRHWMREEDMNYPVMKQILPCPSQVWSFLNF